MASANQTAAAEPAAGSLLERFLRRFRGITRREAWGYGVWFAMGFVIAFPEVWAAIGGHWSIRKPPWPTISGTVGHLEELWSPVAVIVVLVIVLPAAHAVRRAWSYRGEAAAALAVSTQPNVEFVQADGQALGTTPGGRFAKQPRDKTEVPARFYFLAAAVVIAVSLVVAEALSNSQWIRAYVIYGLIALFWIIIPSGLSYWFSKDVPFPTLFATVAHLENRLHFVALLLIGLLVVLLLHLAFYPWPDIFHDNPTPSSV